MRCVTTPYQITDVGINAQLARRAFEPHLYRAHQVELTAANPSPRSVADSTGASTCPNHVLAIYLAVKKHGGIFSMRHVGLNVTMNVLHLLGTLQTMKGRDEHIPPSCTLRCLQTSAQEVHKKSIRLSGREESCTVGPANAAATLHRCT